MANGSDWTTQSTRDLVMQVLSKVDTIEKWANKLEKKIEKMNDSFINHTNGNCATQRELTEHKNSHWKSASLVISIIALLLTGVGLLFGFILKK